MATTMEILFHAMTKGLSLLQRLMDIARKEIFHNPIMVTNISRSSPRPSRRTDG